MTTRSSRVAVFEVAANPDPGSTLPFLIRLPQPGGELVLKARDSWPRTARVYCHRAESWLDDPQIVERIPVRSCQRRSVAIDLVLDRPRENRSQIVFIRIQGGREGILLIDGQLTYALAEVATIPRADVVVEGRYSSQFKLKHTKPGFVTEMLAALTVRYPTIPIHFAQTRPLAEGWTYRFLGAALAYAQAEATGRGDP